MKKKIAQIIFVLISVGILGWLLSGIYTNVTQSYFYTLIFILGLLIVVWITIVRIAEKIWRFFDGNETYRFPNY